MQLFLVVLGGRSRGCHIEQHDVRFVAGEHLDDTLPELRRQWFGLKRGLHLDSWQKIERVEGWRLELRREPFTGPMRLWFINVGAYDPDCAWELHAFGLFTAASPAAAKAKAKRHLLVGAAQQHKDDSCALEGLPGTPVRPEQRQTQLGSQLILPGASVHPFESRPSESRPPAGSPSAGSPAEPATPATEPDDVLALRRLGRWHVHLLPPEPGADTSWQPLRPDWFGYRRIDQADRT